MGGHPRDIDPNDPEDDFDDGSKSGPVTVKPVFNVERYAEDVVGRERLPTILDEVATEEARIASVLMDTNPPRAKRAPRQPGQTERPAESEPEIEIDVRYSEVEGLKPDTQLALLRARLSPLGRVPSLVRKLNDLGPIIEDPKTAYVLGFVDGLLPLETIIEVAGLPEIETLQILDRALDQHLLTFGGHR
jgi:hypothetical protein